MITKCFKWECDIKNTYLPLEERTFASDDVLAIINSNRYISLEYVQKELSNIEHVRR